MSQAHARKSWFDDEAQAPLIDKYARELDHFVATMADGRVTEAEVQAQEQKLVALMREIEPELDDAQHAKVTQLLCELTAYDLMRVLYEMHEEEERIKKNIHRLRL